MPFLGTTGGGSVKQYGGQANLGYFIKNSLRIRNSASAYLSRTPGSAGNRTTWTWSAWVKLGTLATARCLFSSGADTSNVTSIDFRADSRIQLYSSTAGSQVASIVWNPNVYRDPSAWYHFVIVADTTNATSTNRYKFYVNGVQVTGISATPGEENFGSQNAATNINNTVAHSIGRKQASANEYFDGYIAEVNLIDGQALTPSSFGKTDAVTSQWIPKKFASTYGTNGFYLKFADASAATAAAIGKDSSPNGNNWTPNNISVTAGTTYDAMIDSPTLSAVASNYCVFNPLDVTSAVTLSEGNLKALAASGAVSLNIRASIGVSSGKWYWETTVSVVSGAMMTGIGTAAVSQSGSGLNQTGAFCYFGTSASVGLYKGSTNSAVANTYIANDVIGIAFDADNLTIQFFKNNSSEGTLTGLTAGTYFPTVSCVPTTGAWFANFGQRPFAYTPPSGFKSLNAFNLP
jgi:hypothetical protein